MKTFLRFFFTLLLISQLSANAQVSHGGIIFSASTGYGSFEMLKLKEFNDEIKNQLPFNVESIDNFNPGAYYGGSLQTLLSSEVLVGIIYQYFTTGSRIGQKDYSGYYSFDQIATGHIVGLEPGIIVLNKRNIGITASVQGCALFSEITMNEYLKVGQVINKELQNLRAFSLAITPTIRALIPIVHPFRCSLSLGRMFDTGGEIHLKNNKDAVLMVNNSKVKTGWSGWRIAIELNINLVNL